MHELLPSLIKGSVALRAIPAGLGWYAAVDWIPVDVAVRVFVEIVVDREGHKSMRGDEEASFFRVSSPFAAPLD